jgi:hypothetical protein
MMSGILSRTSLPTLSLSLGNNAVVQFYPAGLTSRVSRGG